MSLEDLQPKVALVRWRDPDRLPVALDALVSEAVDSGNPWVSNLHAAWRSRPFVGPGEALFLASEGGQLLATAAITVDPYMGDATVGRLRFIYVRETARRRGIADRLVEECLRLAEGNWRKLRLHTDNTVAARLYERYGFQASGADPRATHVMAIDGP